MRLRDGCASRTSLFFGVVAEFQRRAVVDVMEDLAETVVGGKAALPGDFLDRFVGAEQHGVCLLQTEFLYVCFDVHAGLLLEEPEERSFGGAGQLRQFFRGDVLLEMAVQIINGEAEPFREIGIFRIVVRLHQAAEGDDQIDEEGEGHQSFSEHVAIEFHGKGGDDSHDFLELDVIQMENGGNRGRGHLIML